MARDTSDERLTPMVQPAASSRYLLLGGVAVACGLGVGLGLWARPALSERRLAVAEPGAMAAVPRRQLQIVVDNRAAPLTAPIEVLPASARAAPAAQPTEQEPAAPELMAPVRPPSGLVRVQAIAAPPAPRPAAIVAAPVQRARPRPIKVQAPEPPAPKPVKRLAKLEAHSKTLPPARLAHADPVKPKAAKVVLAKVSKPPAAKAAAKDRTRLAKAEPKAKLILARAAPHRPSRPAKAVPELQRASARKPHVEPKLERARLVREAPVRAAKAKPARLERAAVAIPRKAPVKTRSRWAEPLHPQRAAPAPSARPVGLMRVSNTPRCASPDPGAALVCATPSLGAADRQMSRAYRDARAAGVPDWRLQQEQQRWLAARAAAAREAPWAVHDVYQARIAELNGMTRDAQGN